MGMNRTALPLTLALLLGASSAFAKRGTDYSSLKVGDMVRVEINALHPTQFRVGKIEVDDKRDEFEKLGGHKLKEYLKEHPCPVVIGPGGVPYIDDEQHRADAADEAESSRHHTLRALRKNGHTTMYMIVTENYSDLTHSKFGQRMIQEGRAYLKDLGRTRTFRELPRHVDELKDDPYRSVAGLLENQAYRLKDKDFAQFEVADWLRKHLDLSDRRVNLELRENREHFLTKVSRLLESSEAASQPWYLGKNACLQNAIEGARGH